MSDNDVARTIMGQRSQGRSRNLFQEDQLLQRTRVEAKTNLRNLANLQGAEEKVAIQMSLNSPNLPDLTRKGDIAVFGLVYAVGFTLYVILFGTSGPGPLPGALVFAIACLSSKYGIEALQEDSKQEPLPMSEHEKREHLRVQLNALENLLGPGVRYTDTGGDTYNVSLSDLVLVEKRWELNPNYDPENEYRTDEKPYIEHEDTENLMERYLALRYLWESELVTDECVEARLSELTDLCYRKAETYARSYPEPEQTPPAS
jgi:hypothetical protein